MSEKNMHFTPEYVRSCDVKELESLASEIRDKIIEVTGRTGGHLASSLGAVELCIALHRVFDLREDPVFFDVGHQAYAHKILTGRLEQFERLRSIDGCCGFPNRDESEYDPAAAGHAGAAVSLALGRAVAKLHSGDSGVSIAVVGDGSLTCGVSFEGLNSAKSCGKKLIVILNDNQMAISPSVGGLSRCLNRIISGTRYNRFRLAVKEWLSHFSSYRQLKKLINRFEDLIKAMILPPGIIFQELGLRYLGPVDGNDLSQLVPMLERVSHIEGPVLLHVVTVKGYGYSFSESSPQKYHGISGFDVTSGEVKTGNGKSFSSAFGKCMVKMAEMHKDIEVVSAAMISGTGLAGFASTYPERCHDVGIAEEHAVIFSAGLASGGKRPVCALYSTFLQRAFDCIYCEVVLNRFPVIFAIDRAGIVEDGPTHHGIYDLGFLRQLPDFPIMNPATEDELDVMMEIAYGLAKPCAVRYPRGSGAKRQEINDHPVVYGKNCIIREGKSDTVLWALGPEIDVALDVADMLEESVTVVLVRFIAPFDDELALELASKRHFTIENHCIRGGLFTVLCEALSDVPHGKITPFGLPGESVVCHGKVSELRKKYGIDSENILKKIKGSA